MIPTPEYIAGFFDGEGSVGLYYDKKNQRWTPEINIGQKADSRTRRLMDRIAVRYGVKVKLVNFMLRITIRRKEQILRFIEEILPHSTVKHTQLLVLNEWLASPLYSFRTAQLLKSLKRRR